MSDPSTFYDFADMQSMAKDLFGDDPGDNRDSITDLLAKAHTLSTASNRRRQTAAVGNAAAAAARAGSSDVPSDGPVSVAFYGGHPAPGSMNANSNVSNVDIGTGRDVLFSGGSSQSSSLGIGIGIGIGDSAARTDGAGNGRNVRADRFRTDASKLPFTCKVQDMLEYCSSHAMQDIVAWLPHGRSFKIYKQPEFVDRVMPMYFNQTKITSFTRQLYMYGFQKVQDGPDKGAFFHPMFLRDDRERCLAIQRKPDKPSYPRRAAKALSAARRRMAEAAKQTEGAQLGSTANKAGTAPSTSSLPTEAAAPAKACSETLRPGHGSKSKSRQKSRRRTSMHDNSRRTVASNDASSDKAASAASNTAFAMTSAASKVPPPTRAAALLFGSTVPTSTTASFGSLSSNGLQPCPVRPTETNKSHGDHMSEGRDKLQPCSRTSVGTSGASSPPSSPTDPHAQDTIAGASRDRGTPSCNGRLIGMLEDCDTMIDTMRRTLRDIEVQMRGHRDGSAPIVRSADGSGRGRDGFDSGSDTVSPTWTAEI